MLLQAFLVTFPSQKFYFGKESRISGVRKKQRRICPESFPGLFHRSPRSAFFVSVRNDQKVVCRVPSSRWSLPIVGTVRAFRGPQALVKFSVGLAPLMVVVKTITTHALGPRTRKYVRSMHRLRNTRYFTSLSETPRSCGNKVARDLENESPTPTIYGSPRGCNVT